MQANRILKVQLELEKSARFFGQNNKPAFILQDDVDSKSYTSISIYIEVKLFPKNLLQHSDRSKN